MRYRKIAKRFSYHNILMTHTLVAAVVLASIIFALSGPEQCRCAPLQSDMPRDFRQLLQKLGAAAPDPCTNPSEAYKDAEKTEDGLFRKATDVVTQELNAAISGPKSPKDRAGEALKKLERMSAEINAAWPDENRLHFQILDVPPLLVLKMTIRTHARFFVFGIPEESSGKPNLLWQEVGSDEESFEHDSPRSWLDLYPLHRGRSGNARFLAKFGYTGCAGSSGVMYDAREWSPKDSGDLELIIKQEGAFGMDEAPEGHTPSPKDPFPPIGVLRTEGSLITLPFCWFSAIDTWDNPSLCAVDTYDVPGDDVRFRSRAYNRLDLLPIAKAIEYAEQRDYPAVLGYCASSDVARRLVRDIPPHVFADDLRVTRTGDGKERVELGYPTTYRFDLEKRAGRWLVVAFSAE